MGTIADLLNTAMRDFQRYSGDGLPNEPAGRPLPVGDPASGQFNPPKKQVRDAFLAIAETADDLTETAQGVAADRVQTGLDRAATQADSAAALTYRNQAQVAALAAGAPLVTTLTDPVPANDTVEILQTGAGGQVWQVVGGAWDIVGWITKPEFATISEMSAASGLIDGQEAFANGERFKYKKNGERDAVGNLVTADGALVVDADGMGEGQWVSQRTVYTSWAEMDADPRDMVGKFVTVEGLLGGYTVVASDEDIALSGGMKVVLATFGPVTTHHFGGVGDKVADDTDALNAAVAYCKAKGVPLRDRGDYWFRITDPDGIWLGSSNTTNPVRGVSTKIVIDVEGGRGFDLTGIQNGHRDEYDLRVETAAGVTACYGFIQARPYRTDTVVYSSGNVGKIKLWFAGDAYGPAYYNVASESNVVQSVFLSNRSGLPSAWCKDDYFAGKAMVSLAAATSTFNIGDTLTGETSGATAKLLRSEWGSRLFVEMLSGSFGPTENITDGSSTRQLAKAPYVFGTASAFTDIQDGFPPSTSTFQAIRDMWANNGSADKLWPTVLVRSFASIVFDIPNVNTSDGGDLFEFHGDCSPIVNFGYLHGVHRNSLVYGDVHDATSQVVVRGKFVGLNAGNVTARVKVLTDLVRFEDCVFDLEGDLDFGGAALNGHTEIRLGAFNLIASGRVEGVISYDSQGGSDLSGYTSGTSDARATLIDVSTGITSVRSAASETIVSDAITLSAPILRVFSEGGGVTPDDLTQVNLPSGILANGQIFYLQLGSSSQVITVKPAVGGGNIRSRGNKRFILKPDVLYPFVWDGRQNLATFIGTIDGDPAQLGFTAMTGTSLKGALDTSTVTLVQLAQRTKAIEAALIAAGLLSA